jgi:hypothetical protein
MARLARAHLGLLEGETQNRGFLRRSVGDHAADGNEQYER